ncbi:MAG: hypothetical protein EPN36_05715 [Rhodanobacteraceae bacterium]|nr:MAG: hypothetical protein EPN36_05715 [Rhodanobacteraceae bacterium]
MEYLIFALVVAFVAVNVFVEAVNQGSSKWWRDPLSHYLVGVRFAWLQRLAYLGMAAAECLLITRGYGALESIALAIAAFGLTGVVATKLRIVTGLGAGAARTAHLVASGLAFAAAVAFEFMVLLHTRSVWFPVGAVVATATIAIDAPEQEAITEKTLTAFVLAGIIPIVAIPL